LVEYEDEFGRVRTARRSEVPRHLVNAQPMEEEPLEDDPYLLRMCAASFTCAITVS